MIIKHKLQDLDIARDRGRVCLPYGLSILDMARWFNINEVASDSRQFELCAGSYACNWRGQDVIDLYAQVQRHCLGYSLADAYIIDEDTESILVFDQFERFSAFSASNEVLDKLYPFSRDVMWENFSLLQDQGSEASLIEIFVEVHKRPGG
jgi:hypothetical protein